MKRTKEDTYQDIARLLHYGIDLDTISSKLDLTRNTIASYMKTPEYKNVEIEYDLSQHERKEMDASNRSRLLVNKLLDVLEMKMETTDNPLQYVDEIKKVTDITGVGVDTNNELNVIEVGTMKSIDEFNESTIQSETKKDVLATEIDISHASDAVEVNKGTVLPQGNLHSSVGYETPTLLRMSSTEHMEQNPKEHAENVEDLINSVEKEEDIWRDL